MGGVPEEEKGVSDEDRRVIVMQMETAVGTSLEVTDSAFRRMETIGGGDGILLDDVVAGLFGLAVMTAVRLAFGDAGTWGWEAGG